MLSRMKCHMEYILFFDIYYIKLIEISKCCKIAKFVFAYCAKNFDDPLRAQTYYKYLNVYVYRIKFLDMTFFVFQPNSLQISIKHVNLVVCGISSDKTQYIMFFLSTWHLKASSIPENKFF